MASRISLAWFLAGSQALFLASCAGGGSSTQWPGDVAQSPSAVTDDADSGWTQQQPTQRRAAGDAAADENRAANAPATRSGVVTAEQMEEIFSEENRVRGIETSLDFNEALVTFEFNSTSVTPNSVAQIDEIAEFLANPFREGFIYEIVGHTDAVGDENYNRELSERRAQAIKDLIIERNPDIYATLTVRGEGESRLKDPSNGRSAVNRRVELIERKTAN